MGIFGKPNVQKLEAKKDVDGLIKVLKHKDSSVRREAAMVLGKIADARAVEALIEALKHEPDDSVLKEAKVALGEIGEPAIEPLIEVFIEKYERDDFGLKEGLKPVIDDSLVDEHFLFRHVVNALEKIGTAVEPLICTLKARPPGPKNSVAAMVLGKIGDARAVEPLIEAIGSGHVDVAANAMRALGKIGDARAVGPLIDILINGSGSSYYEREFLSQAKEAPPALALLAYQRLRGESYWVRQKAARALGDIGDKRAIDPLKTALNDEALEHTVVKEALEKIRGRRENGDIW